MRPLADFSHASVAGFWDFVALRHDAWWHYVVRGEPKNTYPVKEIANQHWPNMFRELDKGTIYFQKNTQGRAFDELLFAATVYRLSNYQPLFEEAHGIPNIQCGKDFYEFVFHRTRVFTNRHLVCGKSEYLDAIRFMSLEASALAEQLLKKDSLVGVFDGLRTIPGVGRFFAWQICCDLLESQAFPQFTENDWCYLGPGPQNAYRMLLGKTVSQKEALRRTHWLREHQHIFLGNGSVPFSFPPGISSFTLKNLEHALCEYSRWTALYWRRE